jgi:hypothetical protein
MASLSEMRRWLPAGERSMAQAAVVTVALRAQGAGGRGRAGDDDVQQSRCLRTLPHVRAFLVSTITVCDRI